MDLSDLAKLIGTRCSIRSWQDRDVPEDLLLKAVELATRAPNAGNRQFWHFYVIVDRKTVSAIADAAQARSAEMAAWPEAKASPGIGTLRPAGFFRGAPAAIAVTAGTYESPVDNLLAARAGSDARARDIQAWRRRADSCIQSIGAAIAYLLLVLHQMGLGALWMTGPIQAKDAIEKILKVPAGMELVAFIPVGWPAESPAPRPRKRVGEVSTVVR